MTILPDPVFYQLPPAGTRIRFARTGVATDSIFPPYEALYFESGTAALAALLREVIDTKAGRDQVAVPAYSCPSLISAALFAGAKPVLVDLAPGRPWMNLDDLAAKIGPATAAILGVDLFGIPERFDKLRALADQVGALLIEDSAQYFPHDRPDWAADVVVLSFGRGKPISLLGGGALLHKTGFRRLVAKLPAVHQSAPSRLQWTMKARLYNALLSPQLYWLPEALPFLGLGRTVYRRLDSARWLPQAMIDRLPAQIEAYRREGTSLQAAFQEELSDLPPGITDLAQACGAGHRRLLRYPLLARDRGQRDALYRTLRKRGLGPSVMYREPLTGVEGIPQIVKRQGPFPHAQSFADRLITLPAHQGVRLEDVKRMREVVWAVGSGGARD